MRLLLLRLIICSWAITLAYLILLQILYLMSGKFKSELDLVNKFTSDLWSGN